MTESRLFIVTYSEKKELSQGAKSITIFLRQKSVQTEAEGSSKGAKRRKAPPLVQQQQQTLIFTRAYFSIF